MKTGAKEPLQPNGERYDYYSLCVANSQSLESVMRMGIAPDLTSLAGWEFKGYNTPDFIELLGFRKFKKGFYIENPSLDPKQEIAGYNVQVLQNPLGDDWFDKIHDGQSVKHGWYDCYQVRMTDPDCKYPNAALINYDVPRNSSLDPTRKLRDYLVQVYPDNPDLLLGKAYVALFGPIRVFVSYFVLGRSNRSALGGIKT